MFLKMQYYQLIISSDVGVDVFEQFQNQRQPSIKLKCQRDPSLTGIAEFSHGNSFEIFLWASSPRTKKSSIGVNKSAGRYYIIKRSY
jgi:hypothetical protein